MGIDRDRVKALVRVELDRVGQLQTFLRDSPETLEKGLLILDQSVATACGDAIDLLGLDAEGRFVLIETKVGPDNQILEKLLDHYDWFTTNLALFRQNFSREDPDAGLPPRGILIGSGFHPAMERRIGYLAKIPLDLVEYRAYLQGNTRFISVELIGSNWRGQIGEESDLMQGPLVELTEEERAAFERFERERLGEQDSPKEGPVELKPCP